MEVSEYPIKKYFLTYLIALCAVFILYFVREQLLIIKAEHLSKAQTNIQLGCLFLEKAFSDKNGVRDYEVNIQGNTFLLRHVIVDTFPFIYKYHDFKQKIEKRKSCYKVKYLEVNYLFAKSDPRQYRG
ncbi:hypothetical protein, partial [Acinetobacter sp. HR7]|uniref:hypothetical protein n=1 Tax=Acinetobacter sp. HR7 TaxID=1509403 RepID=UPI000557DD2E